MSNSRALCLRYYPLNLTVSNKHGAIYASSKYAAARLKYPKLTKIQRVMIYKKRK